MSSRLQFLHNLQKSKRINKFKRDEKLYERQQGNNICDTLYGKGTGTYVQPSHTPHQNIGDVDRY